MGEAKPAEGTAKMKWVDANGLALMCFGFSTWMFFAFLCDIDGVGVPGSKTKPEDIHLGVHYLGDMLTWGVGMGLIIAGVVQGMNGDPLGFTSYVFHACILGTIGFWFKCALGECTGAGPFHLMSFFCYAAFWYNIVFTIMAFRLAKMFGVLYFTVAVMFLLVGLNWQKVMSDEKAKELDRTGDYIAGISCLIVACQCFYLLLPVMTGLGVLM